MRRLLCLFVVVSISLLRVAVGGDWPAFRGPQGNGWSDEKNVPTEWNKDKNVKWKVALPDDGNSSPIVIGDISKNQLWHKPMNPQSIGTGVIIDGYLYIPDAGPSTIRCIDVSTGEVKWQERASSHSYWGSIVMAEGRAYVTDQDGSTLVFKPNPEKLDLVAKNDLGEHSNSTPAISNGQIFNRTFDHLWCIEEK